MICAGVFHLSLFVSVIPLILIWMLRIKSERLLINFVMHCKKTIANFALCPLDNVRGQWIALDSQWYIQNFMLISNMVLVFLSDWSPFPPWRWKFWAVLRMFMFFSATPLNNFTQQDSLRGWVSTIENEPKSCLCQASQWLLLVKILKMPQNFGGLGGNGDQTNRKTKTRFEISAKYWICPWLSNTIHWPRTLSRKCRILGGHQAQINKAEKC